MLGGSSVDFVRTLKWSRGRTVGVRERHQRSLAIRMEKTVKAVNMVANCMLQHC